MTHTALCRRPLEERWCAMAKVKIKCASCGKSFKSLDAKRTICPECQAARKAAPATARTVTPAAPVAPAFDVRAAFRAASQTQGSFTPYRTPPSPSPVRRGAEIATDVRPAPAEDLGGAVAEVTP